MSSPTLPTPGLHLAPEVIMEGFFATVVYRLEPNGKGTRFPITVGELYGGRLMPEHAAAAQQELATIAEELKKIPARKAVWDMQEFRPGNDAHLPVNHSAETLYDYFVALDSRPLVQAMQEWAARLQGAAQPANLRPAKVAATRLGCYQSIGIGLAWTLIGYLFFPHYIFTSRSANDHHGFLIWPVGLLITAGGLLSLANLEYPQLAAKLPQKMWVNAVLIIAGLGLWMWLTYR